MRSGSKSLTITLIGPPNAGKTTFVRFLESGQTVEKDPSTTLGIELRENLVEIDGWKIRAIDTGGQELFQQTFWEIAIEQSDAVLFVVDSTLKKENAPIIFELSQEQFSYALDIIPEGTPMVFLLNKQDLVDQNPMTPKEIFSHFDKRQFLKRSIHVQSCSAKFGTGVEDAIRYLISKMDPDYR